MSHKLPFYKSLGHALDGVKAAFIDEPNLQFHVFAGIMAVVTALILHFNDEKLAILILTITFVIILELINTIIEEIVNIISPDFSQKAKLIKDMSAAVVLISAFSAILVGILLFVPSILQYVSAAN
jgi:diacylglycerol kinase